MVTVYLVVCLVNHFVASVSLCRSVLPSTVPMAIMQNCAVVCCWHVDSRVLSGIVMLLRGFSKVAAFCWKMREIGIFFIFFRIDLNYTYVGKK